MIKSQVIRELRNIQRLSHAEMAEKIGCSASTLHNYLNGRTNPSLKIIQKMCNVLHCDIEEIVQDDYYSKLNISNKGDHNENINMVGEPTFHYNKSVAESGESFLQEKIKMLEDKIETLNEVIQGKNDIIHLKNEEIKRLRGE